MLHQRMVAVMDRIAAKTDDRVVVVSHANAIICAIQWWLRIHEDHHVADIMYEISPCSISCFDIDGSGCRRIRLLNDCCHLEGPR